MTYSVVIAEKPSDVCQPMLGALCPRDMDTFQSLTELVVIYLMCMKPKLTASRLHCQKAAVHEL